ncbi:PQQ-binding-like beta-propeller repeat protein, partial [Planctomycetota bacterium]
LKKTIQAKHANQAVISPGDMGTQVAAASLALLAFLVFVPLNYWKSEQGLDRAVICLDSHSGDIVWETVVWTAPAERKHSDNSYATPTPATNGSQLLVTFGGAVACLDFDGKVLWRDLDRDYERNSRYGASSSPLIVGNLGIVLQGKEYASKRPAWLGAYDLASGERTWRIEPNDLSEGYTTPLVHTVGEKNLLLIPTSFLINAYDSDTGQRIWSVASPIDQIVASLTKTESLLCAGGGTWGPKAMVAMDLSPQTEQSPRRRWENADGAPGCCSPVFYQGKLYTVTDTGLLSCYNSQTGERLWYFKLGGRHLASLVAGDNKIYACSTRGRVSVMDAQAPRPQRLARNDLRGKCSASPAIAEGCLFLRIGGYLYCVEGPGPAN